MQNIQYIAVSEEETVACIFNWTRNPGLLYQLISYIINLLWLLAELFWNFLDHLTTDKGGYGTAFHLQRRYVSVEINPNMNINYCAHFSFTSSFYYRIIFFLCWADVCFRTTENCNLTTISGLWCWSNTFTVTQTCAAPHTQASLFSSKNVWDRSLNRNDIFVFISHRSVIWRNVWRKSHIRLGLVKWDLIWNEMKRNEVKIFLRF
jgi:hypothetical protein